MSLALERIMLRAKKIVESSKSLFMSTVDQGGVPHVSTAAFVKDGDIYYVFTSSLSQHTANLRTSRFVSVMFAEEHAQNPFARKRFTALCTVKIIDRSSAKFAEVMELFRRRFDHFEEVGVLGDFTLFALLPDTCRYVHGFGAAFHMTSRYEIIEHVRGSREQA